MWLVTQFLSQERKKNNMLFKVTLQIVEILGKHGSVSTVWYLGSHFFYFYKTHKCIRLSNVAVDEQAVNAVTQVWTSPHCQTWYESRVVLQGSASCPSVLDSSEISTENGRTSRFPRPELEISFSPLQPNRMALRRQGEEGTVTVKIARSSRKRKSGEMDKVRAN